MQKAALQELKKELEIETSPQTMYFAADFSGKAGDREHQEYYLRSLLANAARSGRDDYVPEGISQIAERCLDSGAVQDCKSLFDTMRENFPENVEVLTALGFAYEKLWSSDAAKECLMKSNMLRPDNDEVVKELEKIGSQK